jgi:hypothetical protein
LQLKTGEILIDHDMSPIKKNIFLKILSLTLISNVVSAQSIEWQNTIGGTGHEQIQSVRQTADGGYICGGYSDSNISGDKTENCIGLRDCWVVKLDSSGSIQWQNTIGGDSIDIVSSIMQTSDGEYVCGASSKSNISLDKTENNLGGYDYWIFKLDANGNILWQNTIGGNNDDYLSSLVQTTDGGYVCGGYSNSNISGDKTESSMGNFDYWVVKVDSMGNIQWQNTIGGGGRDFLYSLGATTDGGFICGGYSESNAGGDKTENCMGTGDYWVVKLNSTGGVQWENTIGGSDGDVGRGIAQTSDGGYIFGGYSKSNISGDKTEACIGNCDYWVVKLDGTGNIQWQNTIGGNDFDFLDSFIATADGGSICAGTSTSPISGDKTENNIGIGGWADYWIVKLDASGNIQWQNTIGGALEDEMRCIAQTAEGNYICGGISFSGVGDDKSEPCWGNEDYWIVKIQELPTGIENALTNRSILIYPNPTKGIFKIETDHETAKEIIVTDLLGNIIQKSKIKNQKSEIDLSTHSNGVYIVKVLMDGKTTLKKIVLMP